MSKRIVGFLLAFCVVLTLLPIPVLANEAEDVTQSVEQTQNALEQEMTWNVEQTDDALKRMALDEPVAFALEATDTVSASYGKGALSNSLTFSSIGQDDESEGFAELLAATNGEYNWPIDTQYGITTGMYYSTGKYHGGSDFSGVGIAGKPIYSTAAGTIITAIDRGCQGSHNPKAPDSLQCPLGADCGAWKNNGTNGSYGNYIVIDHGSNVYSLYGHLKTGSFKVNVGDKVKQGQHIASCGTAGNSTGYHLHFELRIGENKFGSAYCVDPKNYLTENLVIVSAKPDTPTIKDIAASSTTAIKVEWNTVNGADSYILSWRKAGENTEYTPIPDIKSASKTVSNLEPATRYFFRVKAVNSSGESGWSTTKYCYTNNEQPEVTRVNGSVSSLDLKWKKAQGAKTYEIYRKKYNGDYSKIKSVSNTTTSYTDTGLEAGTMYVYKVTAKCEWSNSSGGTDKANCESAEKTKYTHMTAPNLTVKGQTSIQIKWNKNYGNKEYAFHVFRNGADIATVPYSTTSYTDTNLSAGTTYEYQIKSYETNGNGTVDSLKASAMTSSPEPSKSVLDVNCSLDGEWLNNTEGIATFDMWINSTLPPERAKITDFWEPLNIGDAYHVYTDNSYVQDGYLYLGCDGAPAYGVAGDSDFSVMRRFATARSLDVNCIVDGVWRSELTDVATFDIVVEMDTPMDDVRMSGEQLTGQSDYYKKLPTGARYCIANIQPNPNYAYIRADGGVLEGVIDAREDKSDISVMLVFTSKMLNPAVFNLAYYKERNPDLVTGFNNDDAGITNHWLTVGIDEGRIASPAFDAVWYMEKYPHLNDGYGEKNYRGALIHYVDFGMSEGAWGSSEFNAGIYRQNYFDLQQGYGDNIVGYAVHYVEAGKAEGRIANARLTVTFDANGGSCDMQSREYTAGLKYDVLPNATRENYAFDGWYTEADGGYQVTADMEDYYAQHHTLYAHWTAIPTERNLVSIEIAARPNKTVYKIGEAWDGTGLSVRATYSDNESEILTAGFTVAGFDSSSAGDKTITVEYQGKSAAFTVNVTESAPGVAQLVIGSQSASPGGKVTVPVSLKSNPGVVGFSFAIEYDVDKLEYLGAADGNFSGLADNVSVEGNQLGFAYSSASDVNLSGETIVKLTFQAKSGAKGTAKLLLVMDEDFGDSFRAFNSETQQIVSIDVNTQDGEVTIADFIPGDVNDSGRVDNDDLILLTRYRARWKVTINMDAADVDGSGKVDNDDLILLTRYRARWKVTLLPGKVSSG